VCVCVCVCVCVFMCYGVYQQVCTVEIKKGTKRERYLIYSFLISKCNAGCDSRLWIAQNCTILGLPKCEIYVSCWTSNEIYVSFGTIKFTAAFYLRDLRLCTISGLPKCEIYVSFGTSNCTVAFYLRDLRLFRDQRIECRCAVATSQPKMRVVELFRRKSPLRSDD